MVHENKAQKYPVDTTCVMLFASTEIPAGKICYFNWP